MDRIQCLERLQKVQEMGYRANDPSYDPLEELEYHISKIESTATREKLAICLMRKQWVDAVVNSARSLDGTMPALLTVLCSGILDPANIMVKVKCVTYHLRGREGQ